jgi:hypothetical protein
VRPLCAHNAHTMRPLFPQTVLGLNRWAQGAPATRPLLPKTVLELNRLAQSAPAMRPRCALHIRKPFWTSTEGPKVRPPRAHAAPTISINRFGSEPMGQTCARYAPTMRTLYPGTVHGLNRWAQIAPTMRPQCAHDAPAMSGNRFGVEPRGPKCGHYVPAMS